jgi:hypothetical protein
MRPSPKCPGQRQAAGHDGDGFGRRKRRARRLDLRLPVFGHATAQLAEHGDHPADLVEGVELRGQLQRGAELRDAAADDLDLLGGILRQREDDSVEPPPECRGQLVDAAIAVVGGGDDVEPAPGLDLVVELGNRQVFSDRTVISASWTSEGMR